MSKIKQVNLTEKEINSIIASFELACLNTGVNEEEIKLVGKLKKVLNKKRIKVSSAKGKGRSLQQWMCRKISELTNITYNQSDDNCLIHSREMGQHGTDIVLRGEALKRFPFSVECKNAESFNIKETVRQAKQNQKEGTDIMIIYKCKEFKEPMVIMEWKPFSKLVADWL